jgi:hypothetical protein
MEFVYKPPKIYNESNMPPPIPISEWGSSQPVRFLDPSQVKCYDSEGKEIVIPKCKKCEVYMNQIIGKTHWAWICPSCGEQ